MILKRKPRPHLLHVCYFGQCNFRLEICAMTGVHDRRRILRKVSGRAVQQFFVRVLQMESADDIGNSALLANLFGVFERITDASVRTCVRYNQAIG